MKIFVLLFLIIKTLFFYFISYFKNLSKNILNKFLLVLFFYLKSHLLLSFKGLKVQSSNHARRNLNSLIPYTLTNKHMLSLVF